MDVLTRPLNVLISEPQGVVGEMQFERPRAYLPYVWAVLKTYYEEHSPTVRSIRPAGCMWSSATSSIVSSSRSVTR